MSQAAPDPAPADEEARRARLHLRVGWWALLVFLTLGILLEALHGFKVGFYVDVSSSTRRHMWTLAHAHGTLLALVNLALAASIPPLGPWRAGSLRAASRALLGATVLLPGGFFLGGLRIYAGDPGLGIALVPVGAALLFAAVWVAARATSRA